MQWTYQGKQIDKLPEGCEAFVYLITNKVNGMMYVGKKLAKFKVTKKPLKGKKNKRRSTKESDWQTYYGSSDRLNADVLELGEDNFIREIIHICPSRGIASYLEAREQFERRVLETDEYYNGYLINRLVHTADLQENTKIVQMHKAALSLDQYARCIGTLLGGE